MLQKAKEGGVALIRFGPPLTSWAHLTLVDRIPKIIQEAIDDNAHHLSVDRKESLQELKEEVSNLGYY